MPKNLNPSLGDRLPVWHFDEDILIFDDGSLGAGFKLHGVDISCASNSKINEISNSLENLTASESGANLMPFFSSKSP